MYQIFQPRVFTDYISNKATIFVNYGSFPTYQTAVLVQRQLTWAAPAIKDELATLAICKESFSKWFNILKTVMDQRLVFHHFRQRTWVILKEDRYAGSQQIDIRYIRLQSFVHIFEDTCSVSVS